MTGPAPHRRWRLPRSRDRWSTSPWPSRSPWYPVPDRVVRVHPLRVLERVVFAIGVKLVEVGTLRAVGAASRPSSSSPSSPCSSSRSWAWGSCLAIMLSLMDRFAADTPPRRDLLQRTHDPDSSGSTTRHRSARRSAHPLGSRPLFFEHAHVLRQARATSTWRRGARSKVLIIDAAVPDIDYTGAQTFRRASAGNCAPEAASPDRVSRRDPAPITTTGIRRRPPHRAPPGGRCSSSDQGRAARTTETPSAG